MQEFFLRLLEGVPYYIFASILTYGYCYFSGGYVTLFLAPLVPLAVAKVLRMLWQLSRNRLLENILPDPYVRWSGDRAYFWTGEKRSADDDGFLLLLVLLAPAVVLYQIGVRTNLASTWPCLAAVIEYRFWLTLVSVVVCAGAIWLRNHLRKKRMIQAHHSQMEQAARREPYPL